MVKRQSPNHQPLRRRLRRYRPYAIACSLLCAIALWLTFQHKPGWYQPVEPTDEVVQRARHDAPNLADTISGHLVRGEPIEITLHEQEVNEWLAALPAVWPDVRDALPPEVSQPAVQFAAEGIRVGCHVASSGWKVIIGVTLRVAVVDDGQSVEIALDSVRAGSLPLPAMLLKPLLNRAIERDAGQEADRSGSSRDNVAFPIRSADDLFNGVRIENRFEWPNGRRMFKVKSLTIEHEELTITLEPYGSINP